MLEEYFNKNLLQAGPFEVSPVLALGVSGGPDSIALLHCAKNWAKQNKAVLVVLTVDHGLRPAAKDEVQKVANWSKELGITSHILTVPAWHESRNVLAKAREWRYKLMITWCRENNILHLLTAHQQDDQVETFFNRLERGSGLEGLCSMQLITEIDHVRLIRPFLGTDRQQIKKFLVDRKINWIDDPSNQDNQYFRARWRKIFPILVEQQLLNAKRVELAIYHLNQANQVIEQQISDLVTQSILISPLGYIKINLKIFLQASPELGLRVLSRCLMMVGGSDYSARYHNLLALYDKIAEPLFTGTTIAGCLLNRQGQSLLIMREVASIQSEISISTSPQLWDRRFLIFLNSEQSLSAKYKVRKLGISRKKLVESIHTNFSNNQGYPLEHVPAKVLQTLPALWDEEGLAAIPNLVLYRDKKDLENLQCQFYPQQPITKLR